MKKMLFLILSLAMLALVLAPAYGQPAEPKEGEAVLYATSNCTGVPYLLVQRGVIYNDLRLRDMSSNTGGVWEHNTLCVQVGPHTTLRLYEKADFAGMVVVLKRNGDAPDGRFAMPYRWEHEVSSLKVQ